MFGMSSFISSSMKRPTCIGRGAAFSRSSPPSRPPSRKEHAWSSAPTEPVWDTFSGTTLEGKYDLGTLRATQDWYVKLHLQGVEGVAEVASVGGYIRQYQVDVDPNG